MPVHDRRLYGNEHGLACVAIRKASFKGCAPATLVECTATHRTDELLSIALRMYQRSSLRVPCERINHADQ